MLCVICIYLSYGNSMESWSKTQSPITTYAHKRSVLFTPIQSQAKQDLSQMIDSPKPETHRLPKTPPYSHLANSKISYSVYLVQELLRFVFIRTTASQSTIDARAIIPYRYIPYLQPNRRKMINEQSQKNEWCFDCHTYCPAV